MECTVSDLVGQDGKPRLLSERCETCIFRPGNRMHLDPGRLQGLLRDTRNDGFIPCHETLPYGQHPRFGMALCRGWWDAVSTVSEWVRVIRMVFGGFTEVAPPRTPGVYTSDFVVDEPGLYEVTFDVDGKVTEVRKVDQPKEGG